VTTRNTATRARNASIDWRKNTWTWPSGMPQTRALSPRLCSSFRKPGTPLVLRSLPHRLRRLPGPVSAPLFCLYVETPGP
jgi:hypothetical protein